MEQDAKHTKLYDYLIIVPGDELARSAPTVVCWCVWFGASGATNRTFYRVNDGVSLKKKKHVYMTLTKFFVFSRCWLKLKVLGLEKKLEKRKHGAQSDTN